MLNKNSSFFPFQFYKEIAIVASRRVCLLDCQIKRVGLGSTHGLSRIWKVSDRTYIWRVSGKSVSAKKKEVVVIRNGTYLLGGILHFKTLLCLREKNAWAWKMTSRCRYPQKLLEYKTCYYVIITSHSSIKICRIWITKIFHLLSLWQ